MNQLSSKVNIGVKKSALHLATSIEPEMFATVQNEALDKLNLRRDMRKRMPTVDRTVTSKYNRKYKKDIWEMQAE